MTFGGEVEHGAGTVLGQQSIHQGAVTEVALHKHMACIALETGQVLHIAGVGELCIDPAETAQVRLLMRKPQQVFSSPAPGVGAGGCKSQSSHQ